MRLWHARAPTIVAESLVAVRDPLRTSLRAGPAEPAARVVRAIAAALGPATATDPPPVWLRPEQRYPFARALAALREFRGALIALPVGTGKTYVALAVAQAWQHTPVTCLVPAPLVSQWRAVAARMGVPVCVSSHERASRGTLPIGSAGLVVIDESHHFRHREIARYRHVADFLLGRPALLLTATPIVNRVDDLGAQLALTVRDDALAAQGIPSLAALDRGRHAALVTLVVATGGRVSGVPPVRTRCLAASEVGATAALLAGIDELALSSSTAVAALVRATLVRALASSPVALAGALRRYRALLAQYDDARAAGRTMTRHAIRHAAGAAEDQLVLWTLLPDDAPGDLVSADLPLVSALVRRAEKAADGPDPRIDRLAEVLRNDVRTIVFTTARETVSHLRRRLPIPVAWCTGTAAGIGHMRLPRPSVLAGFAAGTGRAPPVLIATDVAAEGLDLQAAGRIVHYDLPWTAARLAQREGRAARIGSPHAEVEVVRFDPPRAVERRLRQLDAIARTARAPVSAGLGPDDTGWRWRDAAAIRYGGIGSAGTAAVRSPREGALVGYAVDVRQSTGPARRAASEIVWLGADGAFRDDPAWLMDRLAEAAAAPDRPWTTDEAAAVLDRASTAIAASLRLACHARWNRGAEPGAARQLARRFSALAARAARVRDTVMLARLERCLATLGSGLTAGEQRLVDRLVQRHDEDGADVIAVDAIMRLPAPPPPGTVAARLTGLVLFGRD